MNQEDQLATYRAASRKALLGSMLVVILVGGFIAWNTSRLAGIESRLQVQSDSLARLQVLRDSLQGRFETITRDPNRGIRTFARPLNTAPVQYDFSIWIDAASLPTGISQVSYQFEDSLRYPAATSRIAANGFATYLRGTDCPGQTTVTINFSNRPSIQETFDFCTRI